MSAEIWEPCGWSPCIINCLINYRSPSGIFSLFLDFCNNCIYTELGRRVLNPTMILFPFFPERWTADSSFLLSSSISRPKMSLTSLNRNTIQFTLSDTSWRNMRMQMSCPSCLHGVGWKKAEGLFHRPESASTYYHQEGMKCRKLVVFVSPRGNMARRT